MYKLLSLGLLATITLATVSNPCRAVDQEAIDQAIEKGIRALRGMQQANGTWPHQEIGATALAGVAMLECGVKGDDDAVRRAADAIRKASTSIQQTYSISLSILFLDLLGDPEDIPLIESLMVRLLAGQDPTSGGWTYTCPINEAEPRRLQDILSKRKEGPAREVRKLETKRKFEDLSPEIRKQLQILERRDTPAAPAGQGLPQPNFPGVGAVGSMPGDNSNTQFAALALWVGRRHGLPIKEALTRLDSRFRGSQMEDGGWMYFGQVRPPGSGLIRNPVGIHSTPTMTCSGLIALAITDGATLEHLAEEKPKDPVPNLQSDKNLRLALEALSTVIGIPRGIRRPGQDGFGAPQRVGGRTYYFLWSVERVAVALDLETIGKKDWYTWGAEILLENQDENGRWNGEYAASGADTSFALLFLKRANLARDLTAQIRGKVKDPGEHVLRGGVGFDQLRGIKKIPSGIETVESKPLEKPLPRTPDSEGGRLADQLLAEQGDRQADLLAKWENAKGSKYTDALAAAIPRLEGETKRKAREALANRLTRMKDETLAEYLQDDDAEIRRGAALAIGQKESKALVPKLIGLLSDPENSVARAALASLKSLTGQDLGPAAKATREEREQAMQKWLEWWAKQSKNAERE